MTDLQMKVYQAADNADVEGNPQRLPNHIIADAVLTVTLQEVDTALRAKLTPALNTGTAMDMLVLVGETLREFQSFGQQEIEK